MKSIFETISFLSEFPQISSAESISDLKNKLKKHPFLKSAEIDSLGNILLFKEGKGKMRKKILFEAHRDEVGLCVKEILDSGFISVLNCGGISPSVLPGTEFTVYGKREIHAVATSIPPHIAKKEEQKETIKLSDVFLDCGMRSKREMKNCISLGAPIRFSAKPEKLAKEKITAPSLDNKVGVAALLLAFEKLKNCSDDVYFLFSVGEETTSCGVRLATRRICPDEAYVLDAGFAMEEGLDSTRCIKAGKGPSISYTDTLSRAMSDKVYRVAINNSIPIQRIAEPGGTGTSATAIQLENGGTPTAVISIPVFNMHTPGEIVWEVDIKKTSDLVCALCHDKESVKEEK